MMLSISFAAAVLALLLGVSRAAYNCCDIISLQATELTSVGWNIVPVMFSPYEASTTEHYCNRVEIRSVAANGTYVVLGKRDMLYAHPNEQPFERAVGSIVLPDGTDTITAIASDSMYGFCGRSLSLTISGSTPTGVTAPPAMPVAPTTASPVTVGPGSAPTSLPTPDATFISTGASVPIAAPTVGGSTGDSSLLPSAIPSDIPSFTPSNTPSEVPSLKSPSSPVASKAPSPTSSAAGYGFFAAALGAASASVYML